MRAPTCTSQHRGRQLPRPARNAEAAFNSCIVVLYTPRGIRYRTTCLYRLATPLSPVRYQVAPAGRSGAHPVRTLALRLTYSCNPPCRMPPVYRPVRGDHEICMGHGPSMATPLAAATAGRRSRPRARPDPPDASLGPPEHKVELFSCNFHRILAVNFRAEAAAMAAWPPVGGGRSIQPTPCESREARQLSG